MLNVVQLPVKDESVDFIFDFFESEDIKDCLQDGQRDKSYIHGFVTDFISGYNICIVPRLGSMPIGMFAVQLRSQDYAEVHQGIFREYRKYAMEATKLAIVKAFEATDIKFMMGFTPESNRGALGNAIMCGFRREGKIHKYYRLNKRWEDVYIMIRERRKGE